MNLILFCSDLFTFTTMIFLTYKFLYLFSQKNIEKFDLQYIKLENSSIIIED